MVLVLESNADAEPFQCSELEMFLSTRKQLGDAAVEILRKNVIFTAVLMLADEEAQYLDQVGVKRSLVHGDILY